MGKLRRNLVTLASTGIAAACLTGMATMPAVSAEPTAAAGPAAASPYLYLGWGNPPQPAEVMQATGIKNFTLSFILDSGNCTPSWDGSRPLDGDLDANAIKSIRDAGGDVIPSIGGYSGPKLGEGCTDAQSLAQAYQKVIDAYDLKAIDIDIEASEFETPEVQDRVLEALKIVKENNQNLTTVVTFPTLVDGPNQHGQRMVKQAAKIGSNVDVWTQMPFNMGGGNMAEDTIKTTEALKELVKQTFGYNDAEAYAHVGISSMNGQTDTGETVDPAAYQKMADYATNNGLGRFTFWAVNRDRPCQGGGGASDSCSGIDQKQWEFTDIVAKYQG